MSGAKITNASIPSGKFVAQAIQTADIGLQQITTPLIALGAVDVPQLSPAVQAMLGGGLYSVTVTVVSADILTLGSSGGVIIVPAQGAGTVIVPQFIIFSLKFNTTAYTFASTIDMYSSGAINQMGVTSNILNAGTDMMGGSPIPFTSGQLGTYLTENQPFGLVSTNGTDPTLGDSDLKVTVFYSVNTF